MKDERWKLPVHNDAEKDACISFKDVITKFLETPKTQTIETLLKDAEKIKILGCCTSLKIHFLRGDFFQEILDAVSE